LVSPPIKMKQKKPIKEQKLENLLKFEVICKKIFERNFKDDKDVNLRNSYDYLMQSYTELKKYAEKK